MDSNGLDMQFTIREGHLKQPLLVDPKVFTKRGWDRYLATAQGSNDFGRRIRVGRCHPGFSAHWFTRSACQHGSFCIFQDFAQEVDPNG